MKERLVRLPQILIRFLQGNNNASEWFRGLSNWNKGRFWNVARSDMHHGKARRFRRITDVGRNHFPLRQCWNPHRRCAVGACKSLYETCNSDVE
jgi:hypothetical protein